MTATVDATTPRPVYVVQNCWLSHLLLIKVIIIVL